MADARTADARLRRILHVLPAAAREGGVGLHEVARQLDVEAATVLRDLEEVTARSLYLPPGPADDLQIQLTADRVRVWTKGDFARPVKLLPREALALGLGLRTLAASGAAPEDGERADALRRRLERHLATAPTDDIQPRFEPAGNAPPGSAGCQERGAGKNETSVRERARSSADIPGTLFAAARTRTPCRIRYLKHGADAPAERTVHPWTVARAEGRWYVMGRDPDTADDRLRIFRVDRILEASTTQGSFEVPDAFDPAEWVDRGRIFRAEDTMEVVVRYSPRIARWIREKPWAGNVAGSEKREDGSLVVRHRVADPRWIVGHVLRYGPDAEVVEPEDFREQMRETLEEIA